MIVSKKLLDQTRNLILFSDYSIFLDCLIITDKMGELLSFFALNHFSIYTF